MPSRSTTCSAIFLQCAFYHVYVRNNFFVVVVLPSVCPKEIDSISHSAVFAPAERQNKISEVTSMKTDVSKFTEFRKYYLSEFKWFDGEEYITFNLAGIDLEKGEVQVAVTDRGRISVVTYDLMTDKLQ